MAFFEPSELKKLYTEAVDEAKEWRRPYPEYERLADNGLMEALDPALPAVNDGSLAAALFKLPKRIINQKLKGRAKALDSDEAWLTELANIYWENKIVPDANQDAPFHRKWKDAVRKAAIYGGQPIITIFTDHGADIVVPYAQDVKLEAGKVSDRASDIIWWDVYYTKKQVRDLIEQAEAEQKEAKENKSENYNKWDIPALKNILEGNFDNEERDSQESHRNEEDKNVAQKGIKFCIAFQRGVKAPFYMYHKPTDSTVREWENPDPTGDVPVHYLYCYQDFNNPYGVGIVKLAGGTQNVLDYMRQADILATQLGLRPPKLIAGNEDDVDEDSMVYEQDANWYVGQATVTRMEMANGVYSQLPTRIGMYKTSLNQLIPTGDTSISAESGDPNYSKTPAGVKFQQASLSIDDEDFKDNLYMTYELVAQSMINTEFANMQGSDLLKLSDEERDILGKAGLEFPLDAEGNPTNELEILWDEARATFRFEVEAERDIASEKAEKLEGLLRVAELLASDPTVDQAIMEDGKRVNRGELFSSIIELTTDNDKILIDVSPEEQAMQQQMLMGGMPTGQPMEQPMEQPQAMPQEQPEIDPAEQLEIDKQAVMAKHGVSEEEALDMLELEESGIPPKQILAGLQAFREQGVTNA
jgi:hypothetical protein